MRSSARSKDESARLPGLPSEANLTRIYRKLAVRSRTELARRFHPEP